MKRLVIVLAGAAALLITAEAGASPCTTTIVLPSGDGTEPFATLNHAGVCVEAQNDLFSSFNFGNLPISNGTVTFDLEPISGEDNYDITFTDKFAAGNTYTGFGYTVASIGPQITTLLADFVQTTGGPTTLKETASPAGMGSIDLVETGIFPTLTSTNEIDYTAGVSGLIVTETITVGNKSNVSAIEDTILQQVPEPASLALIGSAITGFGLARRRRRAA